MLVSTLEKIINLLERSDWLSPPLDKGAQKMVTTPISHMALDLLIGIMDIVPEESHSKIDQIAVQAVNLRDPAIEKRGYRLLALTTDLKSSIETGEVEKIATILQKSTEVVSSAARRVSYNFAQLAGSIIVYRAGHQEVAI